MADEGFLRRWSRLKSVPQPAPAATPAGVTQQTPVPHDGMRQDAGAGQPAAAARQERGAPGECVAAPAPARRAGAADAGPHASGPTLDDVAALTADSDFAPFVGRAVDADVRRSALRKLFSDPHFNRMDGLDIYIGDYTQASPMPDAMLAALDHARSIFGPVDTDPDPGAARAAADAPVLAASHAAAAEAPAPVDPCATQNAAACAAPTAAGSAAPAAGCAAPIPADACFDTPAAAPTAAAIQPS